MEIEFIKKTQTEINLGTGTGTSEGSLVNIMKEMKESQALKTQ